MPAAAVKAKLPIALSPQLAVLVADENLREARLALANAIRIVLRNGLMLLGLGTPERMDRELEESE